MKNKSITEKNNSLLLISSLYSSMRKSEQKVADFVLKEPGEVVYSTITDLAMKVGVGETSVIRFCRTLGFKGYQEFKLAIAQDLATPVEQIHGQIEEGDDVKTIAQKLASLNTRMLQDTTSLMNEQGLQQVADAIIKARKVYFFGVGSSGITAADAKYRFMRLGFNVEAVADAHIMAMNASLTGPGDAVVGISSSGSTKDLVEAVRIAKDNGAYIICLTNHSRSPITQYADTVLLTTSRETPLQGGAFTSKLAQIHVLDILSTVIALQQKEHTYKALEKTAKSVLDKLY
jgi:DNA-binding MurR/RpiR family transcriptional regulator